MNMLNIRRHLVLKYYVFCASSCNNMEQSSASVEEGQCEISPGNCTSAAPARLVVIFSRINRINVYLL